MYILDSSFSGLMFAVSRLVWIEKVMRGKVMGQTRFNNTSDDFRQKRKVGEISAKPAKIYN